MGLLDDAIREHLELKRRHGASPEEVERQEREALGATRGGEFATPDDTAGGEDATRLIPASAEEEEEEVSPPPEAENEEEEAAEAEIPAPGEEAAAPGYDEDPWLEEDEPDEVPPAESLDRTAAEAPPAEGDDVLEETPDFLQETPEHDRLWFEQRPPRDFDWDK